MKNNNELLKQIADLQTKIDSNFVKSNGITLNILKLGSDWLKNRYEIIQQTELKRKLDTINSGLIIIRCAKLKGVTNI